jgi:hypothetical protein
MWQQIGFGTMLIGVSAVLLRHQRRWDASSSRETDLDVVGSVVGSQTTSLLLADRQASGARAHRRLSTPFALSFALFWTAILLLTLTLAGTGNRRFLEHPRTGAGRCTSNTAARPSECGTN